MVTGERQKQTNLRFSESILKLVDLRRMELGQATRNTPIRWNVSRI